MITVNQIRAARGLINWNQTILGEKAGLSQAAIANIENERSKPTTQSLSSIQKALENHGVEFINGGVRMKPDNIEVIEGEGFSVRMMNYVYEMLLHQDETEYLITNVSFDNMDDTHKAEIAQQINRLQASNMTERILISSDTPGDQIIGPLGWHRCLPPDIISATTPCFVFCDCYALMSVEKQRIVILKDSSIAEDQRKKFDYLWERATPPR